MFFVLETLETCGQIRKHCFNKNVSEFIRKLLFPRIQNFVSALECFIVFAGLS